MHFPHLLSRPKTAVAEAPAKRPPTRAEFRAFAASRDIFFRKGLEIMATLLPPSDAELQRWLKGAIEENDALTFVYAISAAAVSGRALPASLLPGGAGLMRNDDEFAWIACHCTGDVTAALLEAVRGGGLRPLREATALFYAALWWQEHGHGPEPAEIVTRSRELARQARRDLNVLATISALAVLPGNDGLNGALPCHGRHARLQESRVQFRDAMIKIVQGPFAELVPQAPERGFTGGTTMRRAVEDVGRNEACRCGSGKKYKRCCAQMDRFRWRRSSEVAGVTVAELGSEPDSHLSKSRLQRMEAHELARLNPEKVPAELVSDYLAGLASSKRYRELLQVFKKIGVEGERDADWIAAFAQLVKDWQPELALRLLGLHPRSKEMLPKLSPATRILLGSETPGKFCRTVEDEAIAALTSGDLSSLREVALAILSSPMRALGLLVARGVLPLLEEPGEMYEEILLTRDKLNLSADDEFAEFMEERAARRRKSGGNEAARKWQELYEIQAEEARRLNEEKRKAERELAMREKRAQKEAAANVQALPSDTQAIADLQTKVKTLEALVREKNEKAAANLREAKQEDERKRREEAAATQRAEKENEDEDFKVEGNQPVRLIRFPKDFAETLAGFPRHVGRATMTRIGRLAAGEPSGFDKVKQLKAYPDVLRARVSDKHRLLFCLEPNHIRVVDLIRRADLDRRIERLKAAGLPALE